MRAATSREGRQNMNNMNTIQWPQGQRPAEPLETMRTHGGHQQGTTPVTEIVHTQAPVEAVSPASQAVNPSQPAASVVPSQIDLTSLQTALATLDDDRLLMVLVQLPTYQLARALEYLLKPVGVSSSVPQAQPASDPADNREADRTRMLRRGKIIYNNKMSVSDCNIRDLSSSGCRVSLESLVGIPDHFTLHIQNGGSRHECEVVWRKSDMMGLRFIG